MNIFSLIVLLLLSMHSSVSYSEVWHSVNTWDKHWENEYQEWVRSDVYTNIFTSDFGLLSRIPTDCADALYDIRIQFSYEHSLPFIIHAPDVLKEKDKLFGSNTSMFDKILDEKKRVRAFIQYINQEVSTENLAKDTFPLKVKEIKSGTVYLVEWSLFGKVEHHSYFVKGFNQNHELLFYASDAPSRVRKLQVDTRFPRFSFDTSPYGFRQWRHPEYLLCSESEIPESEGYSNEQYKIALKFGKRGVLREIERRLQN